MKSLPEEDRFTRLPTERKHFLDTLKMIAYRAETSMASLLREHMARGGDDAPALLRQIFQTEADLTPDLAANTLTIRLHHLTQAAHHQAIEQMLADLNATQTVFPGTTLTDPGLLHFAAPNRRSSLSRARPRIGANLDQSQTFEVFFDPSYSFPFIALQTSLPFRTPVSPPSRAIVEPRLGSIRYDRFRFRRSPSHRHCRFAGGSSLD